MKKEMPVGMGGVFCDWNPLRGVAERWRSAHECAENLRHERSRLAAEVLNAERSLIPLVAKLDDEGVQSATLAFFNDMCAVVGKNQRRWDAYKAEMDMITDSLERGRIDAVKAESMHANVARPLPVLPDKDIVAKFDMVARPVLVGFLGAADAVAKLEDVDEKLKSAEVEESTARGEFLAAAASFGGCLRGVDAMVADLDAYAKEVEAENREVLDRREREVAEEKSRLGVS